MYTIIIIIYLIGSSIIYSLSSCIWYIGYPYYNTGCPYSDIGTEYGHPHYLLNKKIK